MRHVANWQVKIISMKTFKEYLTDKKIDPTDFARNATTEYTQWKKIYEQTGEVSFTQQKKFLINPTRRLFPLKEKPAEEKKTPSAMKKPKIVIPKKR